ncbi:RibD family protein [Akkermansiaceae bacterium]|nr:RibD family protein [bacterium]MDB4585888.1 RibD family protein [Akkermansiaceae bacterium]
MPLRVILNFALTADGKISTREKTPAHFTSKRDLERLHEIRERADAILVGRGTLEADQMTLRKKSNPQPLRAILSQKGNFDKNHPIFKNPGGPLHLIITEGPGNPPEGPTVHRCALVDWLKWLETQPGFETLLCEGGGQLAHALFKLDRIDEINLTLATHSLFGGKDAPTLTGENSSFLPNSRFFELESVEEAGPNEFFLRYARTS